MERKERERLRRKEYKRKKMLDPVWRENKNRIAREYRAKNKEKHKEYYASYFERLGTTRRIWRGELPLEQRQRYAKSANSRRLSTVIAKFRRGEITAGELDRRLREAYFRDDEKSESNEP